MAVSAVAGTLLPLLLTVNSSVGISTFVLFIFNVPFGDAVCVVNVAVAAAAATVAPAPVAPFAPLLLMCVCVVRVLATIVCPPLALAAVYSFSV